MGKEFLFLLLSLMLISIVHATDISITNCASLDTQGATYVLTSDIRNSSETQCLQILANNVTLDCRDHTVEGRNLSDTIGIIVNGVSGANVKNCAVKNWFYGAVSTDGDYNTFINVTSTSSKRWGFVVHNGVGNTVRNITVSDSESFGVDLWNASESTIDDVKSFDNHGDGHGFVVDTTANSTLNNIKCYNNAQNGLYLYYSDNNKISNATTYANNYSGVSLYNGGGNTLNNITTYANNYHGASLSNSNNNTLNSITVYINIGDGINLHYSNNNKISNTTTYANNYSGASLSNSSNNILNSITVYNNIGEGIDLHYSNNNKISNTTTYANNLSGTYLSNSGNNTLNNITTRDNNDSGIDIYQSDSNTIKGSKITGNNNIGIWIGYSSNNIVYNNYFNNSDSNYVLDNVNGANDWNTTKQTGTRVYSPGTQIGGNYWANSEGTGFSENCDDANGTGFCDLGYQLAANNIDYMPLSNKYAGCYLAGDNPPCGEITIAEIVTLINKWSIGEATIPDVLALINAWATAG